MTTPPGIEQLIEIARRTIAEALTTQQIPHTEILVDALLQAAIAEQVTLELLLWWIRDTYPRKLYTPDTFRKFAQKRRATEQALAGAQPVDGNPPEKLYTQLYTPTAAEQKQFDQDLNIRWIVRRMRETMEGEMGKLEPLKADARRHMKAALLEMINDVIGDE